MSFGKDLERKFRSVRRAILFPLLYAGDTHQCTICGRSAGRYKTSGKNHDVTRKNSECPYCGSRERHRFTKFFFDKNEKSLFWKKPLKLLHVAPEQSLGKYLKERVGEGYLSVDLFRKDVMEKMDICAIDRPDGAFEAIVCSHVVEHVPDDSVALKEMYRVLSPDGWAVILVPQFGVKSFEDARVNTPRLREMIYGDRFHERIYGDDFPDRLRAAGFQVEILRPSDLADPATVGRHCMAEMFAGVIYLCHKGRNPLAALSS